jgi:hypothetical protein
MGTDPVGQVEFTHMPHPHIAKRPAEAPTRAAVNAPTPDLTPSQRFNAWLALKVTGGVGTMWCAYAFAALALVSLPDAIKAGRPAIISWIAQTFIQLVLLSIIIVGQNITSAASDARGEATYKDSEALLHENLQLQEHLKAQDEVINNSLRLLAALHENLLPPAVPA